MDLDEFPQSPSKRVRLDTERSGAPPDDMQLDDPDDFYDDDSAPKSREQESESRDRDVALDPSDTVAASSTLPESHGAVQNVKPDSTLPINRELQSSVSEQGIAPTDTAEAPETAHDGSDDLSKPSSSSVDQATQGTTGVVAPSKTRPQTTDHKASTDAEFLEAAKQNKSDENAEWRYDSSDAESSSDDSSDTSSDSSSEDDSDGDEILLDPAEAARMLMKEEGGDDGEGDRAPKGPIKTQNELDASFTKPDITVTPDMTVVELGTVDNVIGNLALVKANTSGEYQVLESGSLLCLADRRVVGEVWEPLGRVHDPMYSVGFQSQSDIEELGIKRDTTIYYVEQHSTYVFTKAIKNLKGSDASNMHDEEAYGDEVEFSDDEAEAEYKRNLKQARQAKRAAAQGTQQGSATATGANGYNNPRTSSYGPQIQPAASYPDAINYDDDDGEDMYKPLSRPDNLSQMMNASPPASGRRVQDNQRGGFNPRGRGDRGRGRGRGRGDRGGRGGGGGGFQRGRGERANGYGREQQSSSYDSQQRDSNGMVGPQQPFYPPAPQAWAPNNTQQQPPSFPQHLYPPPPPPAMFAQQGQTAQQQSFDPQAWARYFQQQAAQTSQQQQQYPPQGAAPAQGGPQAPQDAISSLIQSLTQNRQS